MLRTQCVRDHHIAQKASSNKQAYAAPHTPAAYQRTWTIEPIRLVGSWTVARIFRIGHAASSAWVQCELRRGLIFLLTFPRRA
jgi:hypothetical protein